MQPFKPLNSDKADRDLLIYLIWQTDLVTIQKIWENFGLTHSAVREYITICSFLSFSDRVMDCA